MAAGGGIMVLTVAVAVAVAVMVTVARVQVKQLRVAVVVRAGRAYPHPQWRRGFERRRHRRSLHAAYAACGPCAVRICMCHVGSFFI